MIRVLLIARNYIIFPVLLELVYLQWSLQETWLELFYLTKKKVNIEIIFKFKSITCSPLTLSSGGIFLQVFSSRRNGPRPHWPAAVLSVLASGLRLWLCTRGGSLHRLTVPKYSNPDVGQEPGGLLWPFGEAGGEDLVFQLLLLLYKHFKCPFIYFK